MPTPPLTDAQCHQAAEAYRRLGSHGYRLVGINDATFERRVRSAIDRGMVARSDRRTLPEDEPMPEIPGLAPTAPTPRFAPPAPRAPGGETITPDIRLGERVRELEAELKFAQRARLDDEYVKSKILGLSQQDPAPPKWVMRPTAAFKGAGVPTLFASDFHWGEMVDSSQIGGVNSYSVPIAHERLRTMVEVTVDLLRNHVTTPAPYPGIVLALGGDMVSGDIHEELSATNEAEIMPVVVDLWGALVWAIETLRDEFGAVFCPCVTGNHGRNTKKMRAKGRNFTSFDWLVYQFLAKRFEGDSRVKFMIPDGPDAFYEVMGHRYLLTHGDQFRGGDGMIGALGPIIRGDHRKRSRNAQIDMEYDTMLLGHWHQLIQLQRLIVNGSLKGYDEYAYSSNFPFEPPRQALWLTHPDRGITFSAPVNVDRGAKSKPAEAWVRWKDAA